MKNNIIIMIAFTILLIVLTIPVALIADNVSAESYDEGAKESESFESGDYLCSINQDGTATVIAWNGEEENIVIPEEIEGYTVTTIGDLAFYNGNHYENLTSIEIPDSVTMIGNRAFAGCSRLSEITVSPDHGRYAVNDNVLFDKTSKTLVYCPGGLGLENYTIPDGIIEIGDYAFVDCWNLTSIEIPNSVTTIGIRAFDRCSEISKITVSSDNERYAVIDNVLFDIIRNVLVYYPAGLSIEHYSIPEGVLEIRDYAFTDCSNLTSVEISDSVNSIGDKAFLGCSFLSQFIVSPDNERYAVIDSILFDKTDKTLIYCPRGLNLEHYSIPDGIVKIGNCAFEGNYRLTSIEFPNSVTTIGDEAFRGCSGLTSIELPNSLTTIGEFAFGECNYLSSINLPDSVTSFGDYAFAACTILTGIEIPDSVTIIGDGTFASCFNLTDIELPDSVTTIEDNAFALCYNLASISIPDSVTTIGKDVFNGCSKLTITVGKNSYAKQYAKENGISYTYTDPNDWLNAPLESISPNTSGIVGSDQEFLETTFTSSSGNIGNATVSLKKGFNFINTDSSVFNNDLALTAITLCAQVYKNAQGKTTEEILDELGYDETYFANVDSTFAHPGACFGYKQIENGKNLFTVVVRGTDTTDDLTDVWTDIEDGAFSMFRVSGEYIETQLEEFIEDATEKSIDEVEEEENYFLLAGHSLGGAIANYLSINEAVLKLANNDKGRIYTYTFEAPHTCENLLWTDPESESNALNYKVDGDAVTNLPPYIGSTTYGKDVWIKVSELDDDLFNEVFPDSKCKTLAIATSKDGHGDIFGLHDVCLDLLYVLQEGE